MNYLLFHDIHIPVLSRQSKATCTLQDREISLRAVEKEKYNKYIYLYGTVMDLVLLKYQRYTSRTKLYSAFKLLSAGDDNITFNNEYSMQIETKNIRGLLEVGLLPLGMERWQQQDTLICESVSGSVYF